MGLFSLFLLISASTLASRRFPLSTLPKNGRSDEFPYVGESKSRPGVHRLLYGGRWPCRPLSSVFGNQFKPLDGTCDTAHGAVCRGKYVGARGTARDRKQCRKIICNDGEWSETEAHPGMGSSCEEKCVSPVYMVFFFVPGRIKIQYPMALTTRSRHLTRH